MFTNRRPYYGLKMSTTDFFREPVRFLKESNTQESMMEKPYLEDEYPKMHLKLPDFKFKPREIPSIFGPIAGGDPYPGLAIIDFGDASCRWEITNIGRCTEGPVVITMSAIHFWHAEFNFIAVIAEDTIGVSLLQLPPTEAYAWDKQKYLLSFPENANGSVTVCGFASAHVLVSQTFETVVAGMPVGLHVISGALVVLERGQGEPATLLKSVYGEKGDDCGCITLSSSCVPQCECKNIGYTTQQMSTGESQELTVIDPVEGCTYDWEIISGDGQLVPAAGTSTTYTATATNPNCANSPVITLSTDDIQCDSLHIAINADEQNGLAYKILECRSLGGHCVTYLCNGTIYSDPLCCAGSSCEEECPELTGWSLGPEDIRTEGQVEAGCCPMGLL